MNKQYAAFALATILSSAAQAQGDGWTVFGGVDYLAHEVSITVPVEAPNEPPPALGSTRRVDGDGSSIRLRGGLWLNEDFSVELQTSISSDGLDEAEDAEIDSYFGLFVSARAQPFEWLDMTFPVGITSIEASAADPEGQPEGQFQRVSAENDGIAYGVQFDVRLGEMLTDPDSIVAGLGVGLGFMVYNSSDNVSVRGYNAGLRFSYDF